MTDKPPLTQDQFSRLEENLTRMQDLNLKQNKTLEDLKRCYALAYLAGVHPEDLKGRVSHRIFYPPNGYQSSNLRWKHAIFKIRVRPTDDEVANAAAERLGLSPEIDIPMVEVPDCLWDPEDLWWAVNYRNRVKAHKLAQQKENTNDNQ